MALRQTTTTRRTNAPLVVLPQRAGDTRHDATKRFVADTDNDAIDQPYADRSHDSHRKLRVTLVLFTVFTWIVIAFAIHAAFL